MANPFGDTPVKKAINPFGDTAIDSNAVNPVFDNPISDVAGDVFHSIADPLTAMAGGVSGLILGGLESIGRAPFQGLDKAIEEGQQTRQSISEFTSPTNEEGIKSTEFVFDTLSHLNKIPSGWGGIAKLITTGSPEEAAQTVKDIEAVGLTQYAGDAVFDKTGSPTLGALTASSAELAALLLTRKTFGDKAKIIKAKNELDIIEDINSGKGDIAELAKYKLSNKDKWSTPSKVEVDVLAERMGVDREFAESFARELPRVERFKAFSPAIKQEWDQSLLGLIGTSSASDISVMERMLDIYERGSKNDRLKADNRPIFESGKAVTNRVDFLLNKKNEAGKRVGDAARDLRNVKLDHEPIIDGFISKLQDDGVIFNNGQPITKVSDYNKMDFRDSDFAGSEASENVIKTALRRMTKNDNDIDAFNLHNIKKSLPFQISTAKKQPGGLVQKAESHLNELRRDINSLIRDSSDDYRSANDDFRVAIEPLNALNDAMPASSKIDWDGINPKKAGLQIRSVLSNNTKAVDMSEAMANLDLVSKKLGGKFTDDAMNQMIFSTKLDKRLGAYSEQTFQGIQESAGGNVLGSIPVSGTDAGIKALGGIMKKVKRVDNERAIKSMREYLKEAKASKSK